MKTTTLLTLAMTGLIVGLAVQEFHGAPPGLTVKPASHAALLSKAALPDVSASKPGNAQFDLQPGKELQPDTLLAEVSGQSLNDERNRYQGGDYAVFASSSDADSEPAAMSSSVSPLLSQTTDLGSADMSQALNIVVGLQLRNQASLDAFLSDVANPQSPNYQHFMTQAEFNAAYAPTAGQELRVVNWLTANGFQVTQRFDNRLIVEAAGTVAAAAQAFAVNIHKVGYQNEVKFATVNEPVFPADIVRIVNGVSGLDNLAEMKPKAVYMAVATPAPQDALESNCCHFSPNDVKTFYNDGAALSDGNHAVVDGTGQTVAIAGVYAWNISDINAFNAYWGLPYINADNTRQVCVGNVNSPACLFNKTNSIEISLDAEYLHATVPGAIVINYMAGSTSLSDFTTLYNRIVLDNSAHIVTTSWGSCEAQTPLSVQVHNDSIFANGGAIGQSWFAASGDNGSDACGNQTISVDHPANSPHVIGVGGTTPTCGSGMSGVNPGCNGYGSETAWSGGGGGVSNIFKRPGYQNGCGIPVNQSRRLVPDVSLAADPNQYGYYVAYEGHWYLVGGTSAAAPQWAGYYAQLNQYKPGLGNGLGLPGRRIYALCGTNAFHDITTGGNGAYSSDSLYDSVTGIGSINVKNFLGGY